LGGQPAEVVQAERVRVAAERKEHSDMTARLRVAERKNDELERENQELKARLVVQHRRQFKANKRPPDEPGNTTGHRAAKKPGKPRKRGPLFGHRGWFRRAPGRIDRTVEVPTPAACTHCGGTDLEYLGGTFEHVQEDIPLPAQPVVTKYVHRNMRCRCCGKIVRGRGPDEMPGCPIGPAAKSVAVWLRHAIGISARKVQRTMAEVFGMPMVPASAMQFGHAAAENGAGIYDALCATIKSATVALADETGWREDGRTKWAWFFSTLRHAVFHIADSRSSAVVTEFLGKHFAGTLVTDDYAAYNAANAKRRQTCVAHLVTRAKKLTEELRASSLQFLRQQAIGFCSSVISLLSDACDAHRRLVAPGARRRAAASFTCTLRSLCAVPAAVARVDTFRQRILRDLPRIFTFLTTPGVPPTNNFSEQSIRHLVIFRKTSFGSRSPQGSRAIAIMASLILSVKLQNGSPLALIRDLIAGNTEAARRAIFPDTS
jgi:transposase